MRLKCATQMSVFEPAPFDHLLCDELESISKWLDGHPELPRKRPPTSAPRRSGAAANSCGAGSWRVFGRQ